MTVSSDNSKAAAYEYKWGSLNLGAFASFTNLGCYTGAELVGTVHPSNYTGLVVLRRKLLSWSSWDGSTLLEQVTTESPDTSDATYRDDDPQSGGSNGRVYDLDAPGISFSTPSTRHVRQNFSEFAVLDNATNDIPVSDPLAWYSAISCTLVGDDYTLSSGISGDNQAAEGSVSLNWNLQ